MCGIDMERCALTTQAGGSAGRLGLNSPRQGLPWVVFTVEDSYYAISGDCALGISTLDEIVPIQNPPRYCPGVCWDRDGIILLLDLRAAFGAGDFFSGVKARSLPVIVIVAGNGHRRGLIADKALGLYVAACRENVHDAASGGAGRYTRGTITYRQSAQEERKKASILNINSFEGVAHLPGGADILWKERMDLKIMG